MSEDTTRGIRHRSGEVNSNDRLVAFLYILMRDHMATGEVAEVVNMTSLDAASGISTQQDEFLFSNGWLAKYAEDLANRLR